MTAILTSTPGCRPGTQHAKPAAIPDGRRTWGVSGCVSTAIHLERVTVEPVTRPTQFPASPPLPDQATTLAIQPLTEREREVLQHVARLLDRTEIASEMYITTNTVKSHMKASTASWLRRAAAMRSAEPGSSS
jgi:DNA-directed RNA polymerase specialized sigma24 family protein